MEIEINAADIVAVVAAIYDIYETALQENDVPTLEHLFFDHPTTTRYGVGENLYEWAEISAFRRSGVLAAFRRTLMRTAITTYGRDFATANTEYERDGKALPGREAKTLVRTSQGWRIVSADASLIGTTV